MTIAVTSYLAAAVLSLIFVPVLLSERRRSRSRSLLVLASAMSSVWAWSIVYQGADDPDALSSRVLELTRDLSWMAFLLHLLGAIHGKEPNAGGARAAWIGLFTGVAVLIAVAAGKYSSVFASNAGAVDVLLAGHLALAVAGLVLVEQIFRSADPERLMAVKYFCFGLGAVFAYDFYLYSDALLLRNTDLTLWQARGFINAAAIPVLGVAVARDPQRSSGVFLSRRLVFHTTALMASGIYLLGMGVGGYYVREFGETWGAVAQIIFLFGALLILAILFFSVPLRARLWVLINKHLFHHKYDYREEWLRFIATLSCRGQATGLHERAIQAMAQIVGSPGGVLYLRRDGGYFEAVACWNMRAPVGRARADSSMVTFLERHQWVINLCQYQSDPASYAGVGHLNIPAWLRAEQSAWLVAPLVLDEHLLGFMVLARAPACQREFNWEDWDLLKTAGRQAANHLAQHEAQQALERSRRFEEVNRLSAYIVHDIKNLTMQLGLVVSNAERHKHNRFFVEDAVETVKSSVEKMNKLLTQLRQGGTDQGTVQLFQVGQVLREVVEARVRAGAQPLPEFECLSRDVLITADREQFAMMVGHLIQNAMDATPKDGRVVVRLRRSNHYAIVEVEDSGCGMDEEFVRARLFRPFETTKGESGMGIGVCQVRDFVTARGGRIEVNSSLGVGTTFKMYLPLSNPEQPSMEQAPAPVLEAERSR